MSGKGSRFVSTSAFESNGINGLPLNAAGAGACLNKGFVRIAVGMEIQLHPPVGYD